MCKKFLMMAFVAFVAFNSVASAQVTVPFTFAAGTPASADEVNANFQALVTAINSLGTRVSKLEGLITAADLVGTYTVSGFQSQISLNQTVNGRTFADTQMYTLNGQITLAADGTGLYSGGADRGSKLTIIDQPLTTAGESALAVTTFDRLNNAEQITWSLVGGKVVLFGFSWAVADGGRLLIGITNNPVDHTSSIVILTRNG